MGTSPKKSTLFSTITTIALILGIGGAFFYKIFLAKSTDPIKKEQSTPEGAFNIYAKTTYGFLHDQFTFYDIEKCVTKEDYKWFQANYDNLYQDAFKLRSGIDPNEGDAVARISVMRDLIMSGISGSGATVVSSNVQDNRAELTVQFRSDEGDTYSTKVQVVKQGRYWKVKDFAGGRQVLEGIHTPGRVTLVSTGSPGTGGPGAGGPGATAPGAGPGGPAAAGAPPGAIPGMPPQGQQPAQAAQAAPPGAQPGGPVNPIPAGAPGYPPGTEPVSAAPAAPVPGAPPAAGAPQPAAGAPQPGNLADYMKQIGADGAGKPAAPADYHPIPPEGYQPGFNNTGPAGAAAPAAAAPGAPATAQTPLGTVADGDKLMQQARDDWAAGRQADSVAKAEQALAIYKQRLGDNDPKTVQVQNMVTAAKQQLNPQQ